MIAVTPAPATTSGNAPGGAAPSSTTPASPFDAILTLEALAATCAALDSAPLGGGALEGGSLEGLDDSSGPDADETDDDEHGGPLAFLVNLLNFAGPIAAGSSGSGDVAIDDALGGQGKQGSADANAGALMLAGTTDGNSGADSATAGRVLLTEAALAAMKSDAATHDP